MGVRLTDVSFRYGEQQILHNVNLTIQEKEHIGIIGSSGGGKSTLLKIIAGLYQVQKGSCVVQGKDKGRIRGKIFENRLLSLCRMQGSSPCRLKRT